MGKLSRFSYHDRTIQKNGTRPFIAQIIALTCIALRGDCDQATGNRKRRVIFPVKGLKLIFWPLTQALATVRNMGSERSAGTSERYAKYYVDDRSQRQGYGKYWDDQNLHLTHFVIARATRLYRRQ